MDVRTSNRKPQLRRMVLGSTVLACGAGIAGGALTPASAATVSERHHVPVVVGFGDSVPAGSHCSCPDFVAQYAHRVGGIAHNYARGGSTSRDVLDLLHRTSVRRAVRRADTVLIMTGANDYGPAFDAGASGRYPAIERTVRHNVTSAIERVHALNPHAEVVVLDYWAAMKDGRVADHEYTARQRHRARLATRSVNDALRSAAHTGHARFLSTYLAFHRAAADVTRLLASDGDHPDAAGTRIITEALDSLLAG